MGNPNQVDMGGLDLLVRTVKTGNTAPGQDAFTYKTLNAGSAISVTNDTAGSKTIQLDTLTGSVVTLPASTGSGNVYTFRVTVTPTSNNHVIKVANSTDVMVGYLFIITAGTTFAGDIAGTTDDTLTMNGTTTGGAVGSYIRITDVAAGKWYVEADLAGSGTAATGGFSATV